MPWPTSNHRTYPLRHGDDAPVAACSWAPVTVECSMLPLGLQRTQTAVNGHVCLLQSVNNEKGGQHRPDDFLCDLQDELAETLRGMAVCATAWELPEQKSKAPVDCTPSFRTRSKELLRWFASVHAGMILQAVLMKTCAGYPPNCELLSGHRHNCQVVPVR